MQMLSQQRCYNTTTTATRQLKQNRRQLLPPKNHNPSLLAVQSHTLASHDIYGLSKTNVEFIRDKLRSKCFCDYSFFSTERKSIALQQSTNFFVSLMRQTWYKNVCTLPILIPRSKQHEQFYGKVNNVQVINCARIQFTITSLFNDCCWYS